MWVSMSVILSCLCLLDTVMVNTLKDNKPASDLVKSKQPSKFSWNPRHLRLFLPSRELFQHDSISLAASRLLKFIDKAIDKAGKRDMEGSNWWKWVVAMDKGGFSGVRRSFKGSGSLSQSESLCSNSSFNSMCSSTGKLVSSTSKGVGKNLKKLGSMGLNSGRKIVKGAAGSFSRSFSGRSSSRRSDGNSLPRERDYKTSRTNSAGDQWKMDQKPKPSIPPTAPPTESLINLPKKLTPPTCVTQPPRLKRPSPPPTATNSPKASSKPSSRPSSPTSPKTPHPKSSPKPSREPSPSASPPSACNTLPRIGPIGPDVCLSDALNRLAAEGAFEGAIEGAIEGIPRSASGTGSRSPPRSDFRSEYILTSKDQPKSNDLPKCPTGPKSPSRSRSRSSSRSRSRSPQQSPIRSPIRNPPRPSSPDPNKPSSQSPTKPSSPSPNKPSSPSPNKPSSQSLPKPSSRSSHKPPTVSPPKPLPVSLPKPLPVSPPKPRQMPIPLPGRNRIIPHKPMPYFKGPDDRAHADDRDWDSQDPQDHLFQEMQKKLLPYFSQKKAPNREEFRLFLAEVHDIQLEQRARKGPRASKDFLERFCLTSVPTIQKDAVNIAALKQDCATQCADAYGYIFKPSEWEDPENELDFFACGTLIPITRGEVCLNPPPQFINPDEIKFDCVCTTTVDFQRIMDNQKIVLTEFYRAKQRSSIEAVEWLRKALEEAESEFELVTMEDFQLKIKALFRKHNVPDPDNSYHLRYLQSRQAGGQSEEKADAKYWEDMSFRR